MKSPSQNLSGAETFIETGLALLCEEMENGFYFYSCCIASAYVCIDISGGYSMVLPVKDK